MENDALADKIVALAKDEPIAPGRSLIVSGGLLGTCIVFLAAMLSLPHLDTWLTFALCCFVVGIVCLGFYLKIALFDFKDFATTPGKLAVSGSFLIVAWSLCEWGGPLAVYAGIAAVVIHLNPTAFFIGLVALGTIMLAIIVVAFRLVHLRDRQLKRARMGETKASQGTNL